jgi:hypothetical protein
MFLPSRCLVMIGGFTDPFRSNDSSITHTDTDCWEGFTKYAGEMGSGARFDKDYLRYSKVETHREHGDRIG